MGRLAKLVRDRVQEIDFAYFNSSEAWGKGHLRNGALRLDFFLASLCLRGIECWARYFSVVLRFGAPNFCLPEGPANAVLVSS